MEIEKLITELETMPADQSLTGKIVELRKRVDATTIGDKPSKELGQWSEWHEFGSWNDSALVVNAFSDSGPDWTSWTQWGDAFNIGLSMSGH